MPRIRNLEEKRLQGSSPMIISSKHKIDMDLNQQIAQLKDTRSCNNK